MVTIEINNSYSQVKSMDKELYAKLRKVLSYEPDPNAVYRGGYSFKKYLIDKKGFFATGLLSRVLKEMPHVPTVDKRLKPRGGPIKPWTGPKPYTSQISAAQALWSAKTGGAVLPTGAGKSLIIAILAAAGYKTLVVVPNLSLKQQLTKSLKTCMKDTSHVTVENIDNRRLKDLKGFDVLILDEVHHAASKTYQELNKTAWTGIYYRFFLSATYFRNDPNEQLLFEAIAGKPVYKLDYKSAVSLNFIVPVESYYLEVPKTAAEGHTWAQVYKELVVEHQLRNAMISALLGRLEDAQKSTLCLVKEIAHGEALSALSGIPFANGQDQDSRRYITEFQDGKIPMLIATTGVCGEGFDSKPCEYVVIACLGKAKSAFQQWVGRCVRKFDGKDSGKVIIIKDNSHKWTKSHYKTQCSILFDEYGSIPLKLEV